VKQTTAMSGLTFHLTPASAAYWREWTADLGAIVCGRTLFDVVDNRWPDDRIERGTIRITATRNRANGRIVAPGTAQMV
jgi:hypothetical protein